MKNRKDYLKELEENAAKNDRFLGLLLVGIFTATIIGSLFIRGLI